MGAAIVSETLPEIADTVSKSPKMLPEESVIPPDVAEVQPEISETPQEAPATLPEVSETVPEVSERPHEEVLESLPEVPASPETLPVSGTEFDWKERQEESSAQQLFWLVRPGLFVAVIWGV